ncbi:MAG: hypothetical protein A2010_08960 [Nitrospirae bacterium GWD2_57_9]|nr:MAG: hypothetical protein A2010_08960 [Nitrospirae bacterium GWD2_57_9]OGW45956.1 MAG: hypothetical protein A2078_16290 [Nitrospirae bacterium GWC2_57_9]
MKKNMGIEDRVIRGILAVVVGLLIVAGKITGALAVILGVFAVIFLATAVTGFCPVYGPFGMTTIRKK